MSEEEPVYLFFLKLVEVEMRVIELPASLLFRTVLGSQNFTPIIGIFIVITIIAILLE